jgi:sugar phosphate isomerase/epimerase
LLLPGGAGRAIGDDRAGQRPICAFVKFIQELSYRDLARTMAEFGFDGIEATVRPNGLILPEQAPEELPKLVEALREHDLEINVMTTNVDRADDPVSEKLLRTAASLGVKRYRMGYFRYDLSKPVREQLEEFRPVVRDLAALNGELGMTAVYQNHAGARYVGASLWDLVLLLEGIPSEQVGIAFDIRHATAEGGMAWPVSWNVVQPHLQAVYVKDFRWNGRRPENVPLGEGQVDPAFFRLLREATFEGPISLHVEYLGQAGLEENIQALGTDLVTLRKLLRK